MHIQSPHCPSCGAPLKVPGGESRVTCEYCGRQLVVHDTRVTAPRIPAAPEPATEEAPFPEPDATSYSRESPRFELSVIEQLVGEERREIFSPVDLTEDHFALVSLRAVDADGASVTADLSSGAANLALETLCAKGFPHLLECAVLLFDPKHATVLGYAAGFRRTRSRRAPARATSAGAACQGCPRLLQSELSLQANVHACHATF